jgi:Domain of unknown function (DUF4132)
VTTVELSPNAELVRCILTGMPVVGREPDMNRLTDRELGVLAALAWGPQPDKARAWEVLRILEDRSPVFDVDSAAAALDALAESAKEGAEAGQRTVVQWILEAAVKVVAGCVEIDKPRVQRALRNLLALGMGSEPGDLGVALLSCAGQESPEHPDELIRAEHRFLCGLESLRDRIQMAQVCSTWSTGVDDEDLSPRGADPLALLPGYLEHAEKLTSRALERTTAVQSGAVDYRADKAFSVSEAQTLRCTLRAGLDQSAQWALKATIPLLTGVSQAPIQKVKTVPSQSASIAIAKAIAERPSAPLVTGMKAAVADIRHAGLKKKLGRLLKTAGRRMFEDDDFLFGLEPDAKIPKALSGAVVRALEALLLRSSPIAVDLWTSRILENKAVARAATSLVWSFDDGTTVVPVKKGKNWSFIGHDGQSCSPKAETIALWHPLRHNANADCWRALILQREIQQPFNQVFRETYTDQSIAHFLTPELDVRTLLGLARSQGWMLRHERLVKRMGPLRVEVDVGRVYPGASGSTRCYAIEVYRGVGHEAVDLPTEDRQLLSECLRAVDLLVSVSAFSLDPEYTFEAGSARERQVALFGMLGSSPQEDRPFVDGRYVRVGDTRVSIATGRASKDGEEIEIPSPSVGTTPLPYPDEILQRIVVGINEFQRG